MAVSAGDILEVAVVHTFQDINECINVFHFQAGVVVSGSESEIDSDLLTFLNTTFEIIEAQMTTQVDIVELRWRNLTDDGPTRYIPWAGTYTGGTSATESLPPGVAALILWRTGTKKVTGRTYLPPFGENQQANGIWVSGALGQVGAFATAISAHWIGDETGNEYDLRVWSKKLAASVDITGAAAKPVCAYMRRRRQGRGS